MIRNKTIGQFGIRLLLKLLPYVLKQKDEYDLGILYSYAFDENSLFQAGNMKELKSRIRMAYQLADVVREVRLEAFE